MTTTNPPVLDAERIRAGMAAVKAAGLTLGARPVVGLTARDRGALRLPATINPDDRDKWRGFAQSYAHLGRAVEDFVYDAHHLSAFGRHARRATTSVGMEAEIAAFRAELGDIFPAAPSQPMPLVRFLQAGVASVRGGAA